MNEKGKPKKKKDAITSHEIAEESGFNQALDKAEAYWKPRVEKLEKQNKANFECFMENAKLRTELQFLKEAIKTGKCKHVDEDVLADGCSLCHLAWCELRIKVLEKKLKARELSKDEIAEIVYNLSRSANIQDREWRKLDKSYPEYEHCQRLAKAIIDAQKNKEKE